MIQYWNFENMYRQTFQLTYSLVQQPFRKHETMVSVCLVSKTLQNMQRAIISYRYLVPERSFWKLDYPQHSSGNFKNCVKRKYQIDIARANEDRLNTFKPPYHLRSPKRKRLWIFSRNKALLEDLLGIFCYCYFRWKATAYNQPAVKLHQANLVNPVLEPRALRLYIEQATS